MMRAMQVERGKTRPQTLMTGHTGYITHARKILKLKPEEPPQEPAKELAQELTQESEQEQETAEKTAN
jgi:hypothetical protein